MWEWGGVGGCAHVYRQLEGPHAAPPWEKCEGGNPAEPQNGRLGPGLEQSHQQKGQKAPQAC